MEKIEAVHRREPDTGNIREAESEEVEVEEVVGEDVIEEILLKAVARLGSRAKIEVPMYEGNLDAEELLNWIISMDRHFDYEDVDEEKKVKQTVTKLKGHVALWWDELQAKRRSKGKLSLQLGYHFVPTLYPLFAFTSPLSLQFIPP